MLLTHSLAEERALGEGGDALHAVAAHAGAGVSTDHAQRQKAWRQYTALICIMMKHHGA